MDHLWVSALQTHTGVSCLIGFTSALCITLKRILSSPKGVCTREPWSRWLEVGTEWFHRSSCTSSSWSCVERVRRAPGTSMPNVKYRTNLVIYKDVGSLGVTLHLSSLESFVLFWHRTPILPLGEKQPRLEKKPRDSYRLWQLQVRGSFCFLQGLRKISFFCITPSLHRDCPLGPSFSWSRPCFPGSRGEGWVDSFLCQKARQRFLLK